MKALYDLQHWQPSYTVAVFLVCAELERRKRVASKLSVQINPGKAELAYKHYPSAPADQEQCIAHIMKPMIEMLPSITSVEWLAKREEQIPNYTFQMGHKYTGASYFSALSAGCRPLRARGGPHLRNPNLITITLRECGYGHWGTRDSNVPEWMMAADNLMRRGRDVIVIRDTRLADRPMPGIKTCAPASWFLQERARLYATAGCNLFVSNGPAWFALAMDVPVLMFRPTCETANKSSRAASMASEGIPTGGQPKGWPSHQRLAWREDNWEDIVEETQRFMKEQY